MSKHAKRTIEQWLNDAKLSPDEPIANVMQRVADTYKTPTKIARAIDVYDNAVRTFYTRRDWKYDKERQCWIAPASKMGATD